MLMAKETLKTLWVTPMVLLGSVALVVTGGLYTLDHYLAGGNASGSPVSHYLNFSPEAVSNSIGVLSSIIAAVLGIILTVVSIVVQLSATRYTPAVTEMFFRDRTNMLIMGLYVVGCVMGFWIAFGVNDNWVPRYSLIGMLITATVGFLLMAPYFAYVFRLLSPHTIVSRIQSSARKAAVGDGEIPTGNTEERQGVVLEMSEQLTDIAINSVSQKDKIIAIACVDALRDLSCDYLSAKQSLHADWFDLTKTIRHNPDFASMAKDSVQDLEDSKTWVEFKVLRQYQSIYTEALGSMRHLNYVVAINTRLIAEQAIITNNDESLALAIKFFNTYLRATLNNNDVRTAYTILNQYRLVAEAVIRARKGEVALGIATHLKYYAHLSYDKKLGFVTETVAYDVGALCEVAHEVKSDIELKLLTILLEVDSTTSEGAVQEASLRGVRKAQLKLATYYLESGAESLAKRVWEDMKNEEVTRMQSIRDELLAIESKDFWEVSDRGGNFDYLEPSRKEQLKVFFSWF